MVGIVRGFLASLFSDSDSNHGRLASVSIWGSEANGPVSPRTFHDEDSYLNSPRRTGILSTFPSPPTPFLASQCSASCGAFGRFPQTRQGPLRSLSIVCWLSYAVDPRRGPNEIESTATLSLSCGHTPASQRAGTCSPFGDREPRPGTDWHAPPAIYRIRAFFFCLHYRGILLNRAIARLITRPRGILCRALHMKHPTVLRVAFFLQVLPVKKINYLIGRAHNDIIRVPVSASWRRIVNSLVKQLICPLFR
ncbi:hypothetical protein V8E53_009339 [Lactarius tabidus]